MIAPPLTPLRGSKGRYPYDDAKRLYVYMTLSDIVFGDESGSGGDSPYMIVAGYIGAPSQWKKFDKDWKDALGDIDAFHAKEFFPSASRLSADNPYYGWAATERMDFLNGLLDVIDWHRIMPVGAGVHIADFNAQPLFMRQYATSAFFALESQNGKIVSRMKGTGAPTRPPYMAGLTLLMFDAINHARSDSRVEFFMDENTDNDALANEMFRQIHSRAAHLPPPRVADRVGGITFRKDEWHPGIQAADLYCYAWNARLTGRGQRSPLIKTANDRLHVKRDDLWALNADGYAVLAERIVQRYVDRFNEGRS